MATAPPTRASLLMRLRDPSDCEAWRQFVDIYARLIHGYAIRRGLQDSDAADIAQDVLRKVAEAIGEFEYDSRKGRFCAWLLTVTRNRVNNFFNRDRRGPIGSGDTHVRLILEQQPARQDEQQEWDRDFEKRVFSCAVQRVQPEFKPHIWQRFWRTAILGESAGEVAEELGVTVGAVYIAKSRVLARLRDVVREISEQDRLPPLARPEGFG